MAANLVVRVQADRLPDVTIAGQDILQIGLRVSAAVDADSALPDTAEKLLDDILPWKWHAFRGSGTPWQANEPKSWRLFRLDQVGDHWVAAEVVDYVEAADVSGKGIDPGGNPTDGFTAALTDALVEICRTGGDAAICLPKGDAAIEHRTAYGMVETLTGLPHPVPVGMRVFTVLNVKPQVDPITDTTRFIAVPRFEPASGGGHVIDTVTFTETDLEAEAGKLRPEIEVSVAADTGGTSVPWSQELWFRLRASLSWKEMSRETGSGRLIDLQRFEIADDGPRDGAIGDDDYAAHLPRRLAEAFDPAARLVSVFENVLGDWLAEEGAKQASARLAQPPAPYVDLPGLLRSDLRFDATDPDRRSIVLEVLDRIAAAVMLPMARSSSAADAVAVSLLGSLARQRDQEGKRSDIARQAGQHLLDLLDPAGGGAVQAADGGALPPRKQFALFPWRRIGGAAGLPPEDLPGETEAAALDSESGFLSFVQRHWLGVDGSAAGRARPLRDRLSRVLGARRMALNDSDALEGTDEPVIDARVLIEPGVSFQLSVPTPQTTVTLSFGSEVVIKLSRVDAVLTIAALSDTRALIVDGSETLVLTLLVKPANQELEISVSNAAPITAPAPPALLRQPFLITLHAEGGDLADIRPVAAPASLSAQLSPTITAQGARSDLALAYSGPFYVGLLAGRIDWPAIDVPADAGFPAEHGLGASMYGLANWRYRMAWDDAVQATQGAEEDAARDNIRDVLDALRDQVVGKAALDAARLAEAAVPGEDLLDRLTMDAPALVLRIDQLRGFGADAWGRLAGYGLLLGRTSKDGDDPQAWWSLNAARFHAGFNRSVKPADNNIVIDVVDPVAVQVAEVGGVRQSLVSYDNRWLATGLADDPVMDGQDTTDAPRRPEYLTAPQPKSRYPLPALSFGYTYHAVPYLIGHGGVLPVWLRKAAGAPLTRKGLPGKAIEDGIGDIAKDARTKLYLRTRPVGAPRFVTDGSQPAVPPVREDVAPLAADLAIRPPPVTVAGKGVARFFRDANGQRGVLSLEPAGEGEISGLRIVFGEVNSGSAAGTLKIGLRGYRHGTKLEDIWKGEVTALGDLRVSLLLGKEAVVEIERQVPDAYFAEDERRFTRDTPQQAQAGEWRDIFIEVTVSGKTVEFEPPVVTAIRRDPQDVGIPESIFTHVVGKPQIAPEASHRSRLIALIDGIAKNKTEGLKLTLRRPGVEFGTFERWINPALIEVTKAPRDEVAKALNNAHALATREPPDGVTQRDVSFEDPSVSRFYLELVRVFPKHEPVAAVLTEEIAASDIIFVGDGKASTSMRPVVTIRVSESETEKPGLAKDSKSGNYVATLVAGEIYELRSYAALSTAKPQDFSPFETLDRLSSSVTATLRRVQHNKAEYWLASPVVVTLEVATAQLPQAYDVSELAKDLELFALDRVPFVREDTMRIFLPSGLSGPAQYPAMRYVGTATLHGQRWSWRGRPQPELVLTAGEELNGASVQALAQLAFVDRRDSDIGEVMVRRVEQTHVYAGRQQLKSVEPSRRPALFSKPLDWTSGLNLWRFGMSLTSRYAAMFPPRTLSSTFAHLPTLPNQGSSSKWSVAAVLDRPGTGRVAGRPGLALVLPLTEPLMTGGATPPLLALFNDRLYANFNMADAIDVAVEVARHPYTLSEQHRRLKALPGLIDENGKYIVDLKRMIQDLRDQLAGPPVPSPEERLKLERDLVSKEAELVVEQGREIDLPRELAALTVYLAGTEEPSVESLKHWQEFGPDPIRTGRAHDGQPVLLRTDGPIGYTFDAGTEAGRFDHAGLLVSPVRQQIEPWSMIKLRFRRLEAPEGLAGGAPQQVDDIDHVLVHRTGADAPVPKAKNLFGCIDFEGLVLELALDRKAVVDTTLVFNLVKAGAVSDPDSTDVQVQVAQSNDALTVTMSTTLGPAGQVTFALGATERATLRFVVSAREKPANAEKWIPTGDVAIKLRIDGGDIDGLERSDRERWLAVAALPMRAIAPPPAGGKDTATAQADEPSDELSLRLKQVDKSTAAKLTLRPVRLSGFTPPVWCQFAESMSGLRAGVTGATELPVSVDDLAVTARSKSATDPTLIALDLALKTPTGSPQKPPALSSLAPLSRTDASSQLDEVLVAVVTRYVSDAFARLRERPVAVVHLSDTGGTPVTAAGNGSFSVPIDSGHPDNAWWDEGGTPAAANGGRLRFMRLLIPKSKDRGGFAAAKVPRNLTDLFNSSREDADLNPADAAGLILGMSRPIEWEAP